MRNLIKFVKFLIYARFYPVKWYLGRKFEEGFYAKSDTPSPQAVPAAGEPTISMTALLELLKNADPEVKAQLRLALLT